MTNPSSSIMKTPAADNGNQKGFKFQGLFWKSFKFQGRNSCW